jgi:hypothetical protein
MEGLIVKDITPAPLLVIDNVARTLMIAGVIFIASLIIANPASWLMRLAMVTSVFGFLSFVLTSQFLITIQMQEWNEEISVYEKARSPRLAFPFFFGVIFYVITGFFICIHFIVK